MKSTPRWHKKRSSRLRAKSYKLNGKWLTIPWQLGGLTVPQFLENITYDSERGYATLLFNRCIVYVDAIQFAEPISHRSERRMLWDATSWWKTNFATGWTDEYDDWVKWHGSNH